MSYDGIELQLLDVSDTPCLAQNHSISFGGLGHNEIGHQPTCQSII